MKLLNSQKLSELQRDATRIRNICILAHVDHGKTTLADSLVATNGIISSKMAGKLRYMDSRKDEQERGITMKSSAIALLHNSGEKDYLINLIDSPGHVDFSSEVSTAVRLCDGAIVVVDVVEGVCPQTQAALKQAWLENIRPVLVLNKMDRLILEMKLTPLDAYIYLTQVLEQVNVVMAELFTSEVLGRAVSETPKSPIDPEKLTDSLYDWSTGLEDVDDSHLYFSPDQGNVIFASAVDGWGFCVEDFAKLYAEKLGVNEKVLLKTLWGDFYLHGKTKRVMKGAQEKAKKPLFVQFVLENIWAVYDTIVICKEKEKLQKIADSLKIKISARDMRHTDGKVQLQALCGQWLPLAKTLLNMVCTKLPAPCEITEEKAEKLMCLQTERFDSLPGETQELRSAFLACSSEDDVPVIVFVSKMFPVEHKSLPQYRPQPLTAEEMAQRREQARLRHAQRLAQNQTSVATGGGDETTPISDAELCGSDHLKTEDQEEQEENSDAFIAFARVFSGTVKKGQELYVLGPKHEPQVALEKLRNGDVIDPSLTLKDLKSGQHITRVKIDQLFLLMGRELESLESVPAGNVLGIGGLEEHVLKCATLSSTVACPAFTHLTQVVVPIVRVAVEPAHPQDMAALIRGLRLLNQADACVQVIVQETGEHVLVTAGEVHLQRCLNDLRERYAKVPINASEPIVPFRETVVVPPTVDMVNEAIQDQNVAKKDEGTEIVDDVITMSTPNKQLTVKIRAVPLPTEVTNLLESHADLLKALDKHLHSKTGQQTEEQNGEKCTSSSTVVLTERTLKAIETLKEKLKDAFIAAGDEWKGAENHIWSVGPRRCGPNILLNKVPGYNHPSIWQKPQGSDPRLEYDSSFVNGFQLATLAGPLCEEPMMGVCFVVEDLTLNSKPSADLTSASDTTSSSQPYGPFSGQIMSVVKEGCRRAFQAQPQRLMAAMYSCSIQVNGEVLGKMYAVLGRRNGRVLHGDMQEGSSNFTVTAVLPVVESFEFAPEIRKQTSGLASPQLVFSHWEVIDIDPFWTPRTEEEYLHYGEKADSGNRARRYMDTVRRRKGLSVQEKLVEFAEKQRTLSKNK
ncbi:elongation factor-like GTPase 1 [Periplaneta americana]|uniref:elongation factor-like GTPase 1 n=1 Tax=Periplaneta americana TaxID=6978 RepID=UPI0037E78E1E